MGWHTQKSRIYRDNSASSMSFPDISELPADPSFTVLHAQHYRNAADATQNCACYARINVHCTIQKTVTDFENKYCLILVRAAVYFTY